MLALSLYHPFEIVQQPLDIRVGFSGILATLKLSDYCTYLYTVGTVDIGGYENPQWRNKPFHLIFNKNAYTRKPEVKSFVKKVKKHFIYQGLADESTYPDSLETKPVKSAKKNIMKLANKHHIWIDSRPSSWIDD
jgi:hypothetical protein